jgi:hypothetical protein
MAGVVHAGTQTWGWGVGALLATGEATGTAVAAIDHTPPPVYLRSAFRRGLRLPVPRRSASYDASAVTTTPKHPVQPARGSRHSCHKKTAGRASYSLPLVGRRRSPPPCWFGGVRAAKPVRIHPGMIYGKLVLCGRGGLRDTCPTRARSCGKSRGITVTSGHHAALRPPTNCLVKGRFTGRWVWDSNPR